MKTLFLRIILPIFSAFMVIAGCCLGKGSEAHASAEETRAAERAERLAKWERYVTCIDSLVQADHSVSAYLSRAWICFSEKDHTRALRYTDTVMTLVTDTASLTTINNTRYLRSLCFDRMGKAEMSISEIKAIIASDDPEDPEFTHESKLNLAYYYYKLKRYDEALAILPDSTTAGGKLLWKEIHRSIGETPLQTPSPAASPSVSGDNKRVRKFNESR